MKNKIGNPTEPRQTGIAEKIPDAGVFWIEKEVKVNVEKTGIY